jgi:hypothetical protein
MLNDQLTGEDTMVVVGLSAVVVFGVKGLWTKLVHGRKERKHG